MDEAFLKDLQGLADTWRSYVARNKEQAVVMSTQGYLSGLEICADQLESELKRIRDLVRDDG